MALTIEELENRLRRLETFYSQRNSNIYTWRRLYFLHKESVFFDDNGNYVEPKADEVRVILPLPFNIVEAYRTLLLTKPPVISVPVSSIQQVDQRQADEIENILYAAWNAGGVVPAIRDALWHALTDGWGVLQWVYDGEEPFPFYAASLDPLGVYPMPAARYGQWAYVFTVQERLVGELRYEWLQGDKRKVTYRTAQAALEGYQDNDTVRVIDFWDHQYNAVAIEPLPNRSGDKTVGSMTWLKKPTEHRFGRLPFVFFHGISLPFREDGTKMGISVLYPVEEVIRYLDRLMSQKATVIARYADPTRVIKTSFGDAFEWDDESSDLLLRQDEDAYYLEHRGPQPQLDVQIEEILSQIEDSSLPRHMYGRYVGKMSGISLSLLRTPVLMKVAFKQDDMERALSRFNEIILSSLENFVDEPIVLYGRRAGQMMEVVVDPTVIGGYYVNDVKLSTSLPTDEPALVTMIATLVQLAIISRQTGRDIMQQSLGDLVGQSLLDEEERVMLERFILENPALFQAVAAQAAKKAGVPIAEGYAALQELFSATQPQRQSLPTPGAQAGVAPQNPLTSIQTTNPDVMELINRMMQQAAGQQGGRPSESVTESREVVA